MTQQDYERIAVILSGIDRTEDQNDGWWETSAQAQYGAEKLAAIRALVSDSKVSDSKVSL